MDEKLLQFATKRQAEYLEAVSKHGSQRAAARAMGVNFTAVNQAMRALEAKAAQHGYSPDHDLTHPVAPGQRLRGTSTLYDEAGNARMQWVKTQEDRSQQEELMREAIAALCEDIEPVKKTKAPKVSNDQLMSIYPVGDHHIGMLSWHEETGADYDTGESERLLMGAMDHLVESAPPSETGVIILMGDFLHYDSFESVTPQSKHQLDADSRYPRMVRAAFKTIRFVIDRVGIIRPHKPRAVQQDWYLKWVTYGSLCSQEYMAVFVDNTGGTFRPASNLLPAIMMSRV